MDKEKLLELLKKDDLGLFDVKPMTSNTVTADERLITAFNEINEFVKKQGRPPEINPKDMLGESLLYHRLKGLKENPEKIEALQSYDEQNLLQPAKAIESIEDVFAVDDVGLFCDDNDSIFTLKHVPKTIDMPDKIAKRRPCKDFDQFEYLFKECHRKLVSGERKLIKFQDEYDIHVGDFFVLNGVMVYIAEEGKREEKKGKINTRLHCVFENGTESNMLLRSLSAELYKNNNGKRVILSVKETMDNLKTITDEDEETGWIYILRSQSNDPGIKAIENLYKIGFSTVPIEERIKNEEKEPTYLMAPVEIITGYKCLNLNPQKLEKLLHQFFGKACVSLDIYDDQGKRYTPREWFSAPLEVINNVIDLLISGEIIHYQYDEHQEKVVIKSL